MNIPPPWEYTEIAVALEKYMSELSEAYYAAGWHIGLEFELWQAIVDGKHNMIESHNIEILKALAEKANGWFIWPGGDEYTRPIFVSMTDWHIMLTLNQYKPETN